MTNNAAILTDIISAERRLINAKGADYSTTQSHIEAALKHLAHAVHGLSQMQKETVEDTIITGAYAVPVRVKPTGQPTAVSVSELEYDCLKEVARRVEADPRRTIWIGV